MVLRAPTGTLAISERPSSALASHQAAGKRDSEYSPRDSREEPARALADRGDGATAMTPHVRGQTRSKSTRRGSDQATATATTLATAAVKNRRAAWSPIRMTSTRHRQRTLAVTRRRGTFAADRIRLAARRPRSPRRP